jgi:serine protease AprX
MFTVAWTRFVVVLVLACGPLGTVGATPQPAARIDGTLARMVAAGPQATVRVIVQKAGLGPVVDHRIAALGGTVTRDLGLINAVVAQMTAQAAIDLSRDPAVRWVSLDAATVEAQATEETTYTTWATAPGTVQPTSFDEPAAAISSHLGPDGAFATGRRWTTLNVGGFFSQATDDHAITRVEVVLQGYTSNRLTADAWVTALVNGRPGNTATFSLREFTTVSDPTQAGEVVIDITSTRAWRWSDFESDLQLLIEIGSIKTSRTVNLDAVGLRVTSTPGFDTSSGRPPTDLPREPIDDSQLANAFNHAVRAPEVWNEWPYYLQGQGLTVAVVDSGAVKNHDYDGRVIVSRNFTSGWQNSSDAYGHGTFVSAIVAGSGERSAGQYMGIAPKTNLANVRVSNDQGMSTEADVVAGLQWVYENHERYNIRVVNLSLNSSVQQSYHTSPLSAAVEVLWFNGIVVVVSAGNNGGGDLYPPANDPFVITVGAVNDQGTVALNDDTLAAFSAYGLTEAGRVKPELVAPGVNLIAPVPEAATIGMGLAYPGNIVGDGYFRMSGTSMAAPIVSGAVALLLQSEPWLSPDQVKYRLMATANTDWPGYDPVRAGAGYLDVYEAISAGTWESANTGEIASQMLWTGDQAVAWGSVSWNSVSWNSVSWNSVSWNSVSWNSVSRNSDYWGP